MGTSSVPIIHVIGPRMNSKYIYGLAVQRLFLLHTNFTIYVSSEPRVEGTNPAFAEIQLKSGPGQI